MPMRTHRYRTRTWLRERLPAALGALSPKGSRNCGAHKWYRSDEKTWRCYHCEPGQTHQEPWTSAESIRHKLNAVQATLSLQEHRPLQAVELASAGRLLNEAALALQTEGPASTNRHPARL